MINSCLFTYGSHACACACVGQCKPEWKSNGSSPARSAAGEGSLKVPDQAALAAIPLKQMMNFVTNTVSDTLPHHPNLMKWKKISTESCHLRTGRQILTHVLNDCQLSLQFDKMLSSNLLQLCFKDTFLEACWSFTASFLDYIFTEHICLCLSRHTVCEINIHQVANIPSLSYLLFVS